ncbi:MAG: reverse transcriptase domain-containing protein [Bacteroidales bacterium]|jgi:hypothetical protein|nr:reverse transcriptase domain-containing protein [Prolixibacteraceae bacterium]MDY0085955.1 reverse transcriptase domain-containing protein [Bacteroidales bacterium]
MKKPVNIFQEDAGLNQVKTEKDLHTLLQLIYVQKREVKKNPLSYKAFKYFTSPSIAKNRYKVFTIKKKSGGVRIINSPVNILKSFQWSLNVLLQEVFEPHKAATGFKAGNSIVDNARPHVNMNYVFNIDLKDFFSSIDQARIWKRLQFPPFNLNKETGRLEIANRIAALCCTEMEVERLDGHNNWIKVKKNVLPQGAPTSPIISNIIAYRLDYQLTGLAKRFGLNYTRYADDITFSSLHNVYQTESEFIKELFKIVKGQNFYINPAKTRLQKAGFVQETTGLKVNEKVNVKTHYIKEIRMWLYYWERYGYNRANEIFQRDYYRDKSHIKKQNPLMENVLDGKLEYLKMVKGEGDSTYLKLQKRFLKLVAPQSHFAEILHVWEKNGIDKAIDLFHEKLKE